MSNARLCWDNAALDALDFLNDGYGTWDISLHQMGREDLSARWVSPGLAAADTRFTFTLNDAGANPTIKMFALANHNLTLSATVRLRVSTSSGFGTTVYDSGTVSAWPASVTAASRKGLMATFVHKLSTPASAYYWRVDISDAGNPDGYVTVGRLFAGMALWEPTVNMSLGASLGFEPNYAVQKALNGAEWFTEAGAHRVAKFQIDYLGVDEMLNNGFDLMRNSAGTRREVLFQYDPADTVHAVRRTLFGRLRALSPIEQPKPTSLGAAFEIKEAL